jgi:Mg2+-importing ATPase
MAVVLEVEKDLVHSTDEFRWGAHPPYAVTRIGPVPHPPPDWGVKRDFQHKDSLPARLTELVGCTTEQVLLRLGTSSRGLAPNEVELRRAQFGPNRVVHEEHATVPRQLLQRLLNPLNLLLLVLASLSTLMGDREAAVLISVMVVLSVSLSLLQERKSDAAAKKLRAMVHTTASVLRAGETTQPREIPLEDLVPGDLVHLSAGDMIPADLRLVAAKDLFVNQAALTGEPLPAEKHAAPQTVTATTLESFNNLCFMGTTVVSGTATGVVVLTGPRAYFGQVAEAIASQRVETSFDRGANRFAWLMIRFILVMTPLVFVINGLTKGDWLQALLFASAVAVGLTPEMLPMIVTVNLAKGAIAMARLQVIVKRLNSIQNFGAMDVLCTDKTGTLTQNRVILQKHVDLFDHDSPEVLEYAYLNSCHQSGLHNLLDIAVMQHPDAQALTQLAAGFRKLDEVPFDFERRRMSVAVEGRGRRQLICKGAVEEVLSVCTTGRVNGATFPLDSAHLEQLRATVDDLNSDGFRVIAIAFKDLPAERDTCVLQDESKLTLLGYIAFLDPPKESAGRAIAALAAHGVSVKVLTGDNEIITRKICREVNLPVERVMLGNEVESLTADQLRSAVEAVQVFAKLSPLQKAHVIAALQAHGHVVGFLGDGINDGPALKAADVGISVDTAVDIAKESADIILLEKSLLVLDQGVTEGRKVFGNVVKYIRMGASSNFGNMLSVLGASAWLPFLPMLPVQVLVNNLLYDISQTAIPTDTVDEEYLQRPRRWEIGNIARFMVCVGPISSLFDYLTFGMLFFLFGTRTPAQAALFQTGWFVESLLSQTLIIHVLRTRHLAFIRSHASLPLTLTTSLVCMLGIGLVYSPLAPALGFVPLPALYWPLLAALLIAYFILTHTVKTWLHRRFGLE